MMNPFVTDPMNSLMVNLPLAGLWFRESASQATSDNVDWIFHVILWICIFFFFLIIGLMVLFMLRYRAKPGRMPEHTPHHSNLLEAAWSIIPTFIVIWIFAVGFIHYLDLRTPPEGAYEIQVVAKKWSWTFIYPTGHIDANLHVPVDQPVKLVMSSDDVIHSLFIPAFRVKMDCVPGRYSTLWFKADKPTEDYDEAKLAGVDTIKETGADKHGYDLFCTEYCGQGHSAMIAKVIVHESGTFGDWMKKAMTPNEEDSPYELGEKLYKQRGCAQCHSLDGKAGTGPTFENTFGSIQKTDKGEVTVDENYIRESILNPMAKIRDGYKGVMPSFQGQLREHEIAALIWFHKAQNESLGIDIPPTWKDAGGVPGLEKSEETADGDQSAADETPAEEPAAEEEAAKEEASEESAVEEKAA